MPLSLLHLRKPLKPLTWLLGIALLVSVSPHLTQGLDCENEGHSTSFKCLPSIFAVKHVASDLSG